MDQNDTPNNLFPIYGNVIKRHSYFLNLIEGAALSCISLAIVKVIPFTPIANNVARLVCVIVSLYVCVKGIKGRTLTETLMAEIKFRRNKRLLHLRGPQYEKSKNTFGSGDEGMSVVERVYYSVYNKLTGFVDENLEEEHSQDPKDSSGK